MPAMTAWRLRTAGRVVNRHHDTPGERPDLPREPPARRSRAPRACPRRARGSLAVACYSPSGKKGSGVFFGGQPGEKDSRPLSPPRRDLTEMRVLVAGLSVRAAAPSG